VKSALYLGQLRHRRFAPRTHEFTYPLFMAWLDLAELGQVFRGRWLWSTRHPALARFRRGDYHGDPALPLDEAVRRTVAAATGRRPAGPVRLLTHLRTFGFLFNPVSFYYCFDAADQRVEAVLAEVTNTPWLERRAYVLPASGDGPVLRATARKDLHVSPFLDMDLDWDWRFSRPGGRLAAHVEARERGEKLFDATLALARREITGASLAWALVRFPAMPLLVVLWIHWQALRLWLKRVPIFDHPRKRARRAALDRGALP